MRLPFGLNPAQTPVLGSYGSPSGTGSLTSDWYRLPERSDDTPLLTMAVAGSVEAVDGIGVGDVALTPGGVVALRRLGEELGLQTGQRDAGAVGGEQIGQAGADAARRARDEEATAAQGRGVLRAR